MKELTKAVMIMMCLISTTSFAQTNYSCTGEEIAFDGYDLVSYFENAPTKGKDEFAVEYDGLTLLFCTAKHQDAFIEDPERYMPKYGGWCSTAMALGVYNQPDYEMWEIQEGELLFFEVKAFWNGKTQWMKDPDKHLILADRYYRISTKALAER